MATWGEFISEFKITNMKGTVYIHADQVLDVWEERNKLRKELAEAQAGGGGAFAPPPESLEAMAAATPIDVNAAVAEERERCARDVEEFADACAAEPDQPEYVAMVLRTAAELIRGRGQVPVAEEPILESDVEQAILATSIPAAEAPAAEPVEHAVEHETMQE